MTQPLPAVRKRAASVSLQKSALHETPSASHPARPKTILLVDDDQAVREGLRRVLCSEGWHVVAATDGAEALDHLSKLQPDLMITDLRMADVSGWDLLFHEHMQRPGLPVFVITALPPEDTGGADRFALKFFQKPIDFDALVFAINEHFSG